MSPFFVLKNGDIFLIWQLRYTYKKMKFEETTLHEQKDAGNKKDTIDLEHDDSAR